MNPAGLEIDSPAGSDVGSWPDSADLDVAASWLLAGVHRSCCQRRCEGSA